MTVQVANLQHGEYGSTNADTLYFAAASTITVQYAASLSVGDAGGLSVAYDTDLSGSLISVDHAGAGTEILGFVAGVTGTILDGGGVATAPTVTLISRLIGSLQAGPPFFLSGLCGLIICLPGRISCSP